MIVPRIELDFAMRSQNIMYILIINPIKYQRPRLIIYRPFYCQLFCSFAFVLSFQPIIKFSRLLVWTGPGKPSKGQNLKLKSHSPVWLVSQFQKASSSSPYATQFTWGHPGNSGKISLNNNLFAKMKFMLILSQLYLLRSHFLISFLKAGQKIYVNSVIPRFFNSLQCIKNSQQLNKVEIRSMSNKSRLNWSSEEDKLLKYLRDEEKVEKWNEVANRLKIISNHPRTSKQCRERYISTAKFCESQDQIKNWTQNQQSLIFKLYLEHGPKWTFFTQFFDSRSENSIKNRFYNFIRKILRKMNQLNENRYPYNKKSLKIQSLLVILELSKKIQTESQSLIGQKPNPQMELLLIRNEILKFSLTLDQTSSSQVLNLVDRIHKTNCYLRHLGIFKAKNKKTWKLDKKRLLYILGMQGCPKVYKAQKFEEDVSTTKNFHSPVSSPSLSQQSSQKNMLENVFEELDLDASYQFNNWTDDFNKKMFEILGEDILPSFNFDCFI